MQWSLRLEILDRLYLLQEIMVLFGQDGDIRSEKHRFVGRYDTMWCIPLSIYQNCSTPYLICGLPGTALICEYCDRVV